MLGMLPRPPREARAEFRVSWEGKMNSKRFFVLSSDYYRNAAGVYRFDQSCVYFIYLDIIGVELRNRFLSFFLWKRRTLKGTWNVRPKKEKLFPLKARLLRVQRRDRKNTKHA